jgi:hypothetical protein|tara:strand:- start:254 stop:913 length:660 start_codon:yes stop_codon:yes gene_type:complete
MKITKSTLKTIIKEEIEKVQEQKGMEQYAADIRKNFQLLNQLKKEMAAAPERHKTPQDGKRMTGLFNMIVGPYLKKGDQIADRVDDIDDPRELRQFLKTVYRPYIKQANATLMKFYKTAKQFKVPITKQYYKMLLPKIEQDLNHARTMFKIASKEAAKLGFDPGNIPALMDKMAKEKEALNKKTAETEKRVAALAKSNEKLKQSLMREVDDDLYGGIDE